MNGARWRHLSWQWLLQALVLGWFGVGAAQSQQAKPTDEDVDRAIRVCWVGMKSDVQVKGGLDLLKRRILTGEGEFSKEDIPSVIGTGRKYQAFAARWLAYALPCQRFANILADTDA